MKNKEVVIIGNLKNELIEKEILKVANAYNISFTELKESIELFTDICDLAPESMKENINSISSSNFKLIDYPKERTSVIPPNFYRKKF